MSDLFLILAMFSLLCFLLGVAPCMLSSIISQEEERHEQTN